MKIFFVIAALVAAMVSSANAQAIPSSFSPGPRYEVFGGISRARADIGTDQRPNGWNSSFNIRMNNWLSAEAALGGMYAKNYYNDRGTSLHTLLFGPRISFPIYRFTPSMHVGAGLARWNVSGFGSATQIAKTGGVGLDVRLTDRISLRLLQADYLNTRFNDHDNAVFSTGVIYGLGGRR